MKNVNVCDSADNIGRNQYGTYFLCAGKSLLWVAALGIMVLFIYAVISFAFLHESFFVENPEFPLFCESLGQCFVSVMRYGLLDNIGLVRIFCMLFEYLEIVMRHIIA